MPAKFMPDCLQAPKGTAAVVSKAELRSPMQAVDDALAEERLPGQLTAAALYDAMFDSIGACALYRGGPDHFRSVSSRLLSVNYNIFGNLHNLGESSWSGLFGCAYTDWTFGGCATRGDAAPLLSAIFRSRATAKETEEKVKRQMELMMWVYIGSGWSGGSWKSKISDAFPDLPEGMAERAAALAQRQRQTHSGVLLQIVLPRDVANSTMQISSAYGWSPTALPSRPTAESELGCDHDFRFRAMSNDSANWAKDFLVNVFQNRCESSILAEQYFKADGPVAKYDVLKHQVDGPELQARLLLTREVSGFVDGRVHFYAYGTLFEHKELMQVLVGMADCVRKTLR